MKTNLPGFAKILRLSLVTWQLASCPVVRGAEDIMSAASGGDLEKVRALLVSQSDLVGFTNKYGETALHCAAKAGQEAVVRLLLGHHADANAAAGWARCTPLHYVLIFSQNPQVVELLLAL
jgi:ankyrin repeat protein